jgi:hypothetical protein
MEELKMEKLSGDNYRHWSLIAQGVLVTKGCWQAIEPGFGDAPTAAQSLIDQKARTTLYMIVGKASLDDIADIPTAKGAWEALRKINTEYDTYHGLITVKDFVNATKEETETVVEYISRRNNLHCKAASAGFPFSEKQQCGFILLGLPEEYESACRTFNAPVVGDGDLNFTKVKSKLKEEERRLGRKHEATGALRSHANPYARHDPHQRPYDIYAPWNAVFSGGNMVRGVPPAYYQQQMTHRTMHGAPPAPHHLPPNPPTPNGGPQVSPEDRSTGQTRPTQSNGGSSKQSKLSQGDKCFSCHKPGHFSRDCKEKGPTGWRTTGVQEEEPGCATPKGVETPGTSFHPPPGLYYNEYPYHYQPLYQHGLHYAQYPGIYPGSFPGYLDCQRIPDTEASGLSSQLRHLHTDTVTKEDKGGDASDDGVDDWDDDRVDDWDGDVSEAMLATTLNGTTTKNPNEWVLDSAATDHMTFHGKKFTDPHTQRHVEVRVGNGRCISGYGNGPLSLPIKDKKSGRTSRIDLKDTLWVPEIHYNLLSVRRLTRDGLQVRMIGARAYILSSDDRVIGIGKQRNGLYIFKEEPKSRWN